MLSKFKKEITGFSLSFRIVFSILFFVYLGFWSVTIYLSNIQIKSNLEPVFPVAPQDSEEYRNLAESMLGGQGFSQNGKVDTLRAPGYPAFVALFKYLTGSYFVVTLVQIFLVFTSALIIRRLGILFHSEKGGEIASIFSLLIRLF